VLGQPAVAGGVVYVRGSNGILYAFAAYTSTEPDLTPLWTYQVPGVPQTGRLAVSGGTIFATTSSAGGGGLIAISASTHKQEWLVKTAAKLNAPAIAGGTVYVVTQNGLLIALNAATGAHRWTANLHDTSSGADTFHPAVADGVVYALSNAGTAYAFNARTGALLWSHPSGGALRTVPVIANGILYIGTKSGGVAAFAAR
jgi:eukaryotic-like serine/threonine-protein kinase